MKMQLLISALLLSVNWSVGFAAQPAEVLNQATPKEEAMHQVQGHDSVEQKVMDEVNAMDNKEAIKPADASVPAKDMNSCRCPDNPASPPADKVGLPAEEKAALPTDNSAVPADKKLELPPVEKIIEPLVQPK